jgi:two-component system, NarL family, sensor kinase
MSEFNFQANVSISPPLSGGLMWSFSKRSRQMSLSHAELEGTIVECTEEVQNLSQRLLKVQDEERRRLARNLHDSTGQTLTALKIGASLLQEDCKQCPSALRSVSEVVALADQAINEIRTMSYLLHPPLLDEVGFRSAAEWYVEGFSKRSGINVTFDFATEHQRLPIAIETALFRILQESLTNVHRHSKAKQASVRYLCQRGFTILEIRDFGCGIAAERLAGLREVNGETGVGLAGMRERLNELNGRLELESDGHGTNVRAIVPLPMTMPYLQARDFGQVSQCASAD